MNVFKFFKKKKHSTPVLPFQDTTEPQTNNNLDTDETDIKSSTIADESQNEKESAEEQKRTLKALINEKAVECGDRSTVHGVPTLSNPQVNIFAKIFWTLALLASWSIFFYQIYLMVQAYQTYSVVSSLKSAYEAPATFPAVVICDLTPYTYSDMAGFYSWVIQERNAYFTGLLDITWSSYTSFRDYIDTSMSNLKASMEYYDGETWSDPRDHEAPEYVVDKYSWSLNLSKSLISCEFQGVPCSVEDFYVFHDFNYGNCYRFNGDDASTKFRDYSYVQKYQGPTYRQSAKAGPQSGLKIELYAGNQNTDLLYSYRSGFRLVVHNQSVIPFVDEMGIDIATGVQTNVAISRSFLSRLPAPYSDCISDLDEDTGNKNFILGIMYQKKKNGTLAKYFQEYCLKVCFYIYEANRCNCTDFSLKFLDVHAGNDTFCINACDIQCNQQIEKEFYNSDGINDCYSQCPIECDTAIYETSVSMASYPSEWYATLYNTTNIESIYGENASVEYISSTTSMINVYYETLRYSMIQEAPSVSLEILISNVGSIFGVLTGSSFLSVIELLEISATVIILAIIHKKKNKVQNTNANKIDA